MTAPQNEFTKLGFTKTFILPAMWIFLVPALSWMFFLHAQSRFDAQALESILQQIRIDQKLSEQERAQATEFYTKVPVSKLMTNPEFAAQTDPTARFNYATFRWMIRLSYLSIAAGITVFVVAGILVLLSFRSPFIQYISLLAGWHVLRIYSALQTIVIGVQLVALSFWVTALWMNFYSVKLIGVAGILSVMGVGAVLIAIFTRPRTEQTVEGTILERDAAPRLWEELSSICAKVGVNPPDQVIAGIDDNFFVTEHPITMNGTRLTGKTLYVSLPLLKQLHATEADTILAHEMAHFSGQDTLYSKRISPLLLKYQAYLKGLHEGGISLPVFHFMVCFRVLFELSLNSLSRKREFRADSIAAKVTSPRDSAGALLRTMAYSKFRQSVEMDLFKQTEAMEKADVSARVEQGFLDYAEKFASDPEIGKMETAHPFDSHPPLSQRLGAVGIELDENVARSLLTSKGDGAGTGSSPMRKNWSVSNGRRMKIAFDSTTNSRFPIDFYHPHLKSRLSLNGRFHRSVLREKKEHLRSTSKRFITQPGSHPSVSVNSSVALTTTERWFSNTSELWRTRKPSSSVTSPRTSRLRSWMRLAGITDDIWLQTSIKRILPRQMPRRNRLTMSRTSKCRSLKRHM